ncbi:Coenzyme F420 hydrogenase/dehydrogenase, beta subunit C-terminal domain [Butyricimonas hominis]|uniref:Coenzyme F420 hydrogenase/dehydrogenase, beta subunit C-terminal domain n=1 Tax=Butyricimonas hominis TaxID=2763032 RepID=A0ABR7D2A7_9BACT|nr:Coenzyme F420 hydrogenase/dehydrogenase, beta subunit C-terminal domain [Butyricimonas hominis]MBC5622068.1 Coenzyme F420 hydrogenase/dehydrogenase, beta subunit C-terminal domain [Butyricimonas hominis]
MINIQDKKDCCGCGACVQRCPKRCITMQEDKEGFLYPEIDRTCCIDCGLCEKVCPVINQGGNRSPIEVYASKCQVDEIRINSSSGGIFSMLAEKIIENGGVVFGARFNDRWEVVHDYAETIEGIIPFRGSKYVQSVIGETYKQAEVFLKQGRFVLFSGTSCQISGLLHFLRKDYKNLITVDVICHGVPSPLVWCQYLKEIGFIVQDKKPVISGISFRNKRLGWRKYGFEIRYDKEEANFFEMHRNNIFMRGFLHNIYSRPSCYACPAKGGRSQSDITLGDYWGVELYHPEFYDDKGVSAVLINTEKGKRIYSQLKVDGVSTDYNKILLGNSCIEHSVKISKYRDDFFDVLNKSEFSLIGIITKRTRPSLLRRIISYARRITGI